MQISTFWPLKSRALETGAQSFEQSRIESESIIDDDGGGYI